MVSRPLGRTGLSLSPIGFGAFKIGRNEGIKYPSGYVLPSDAEVERLLSGILDMGINYIDTAPAYGLSEERIGKAIAHRRSEFVLSTKVGETFEAGRSTYDFSATAVRASVERSLERLRTDVIDLVFIHANADDVSILTSTDVVAALLDLKRSGKIRFVGLSGKTASAERLALDWADALMVEFHAHDDSHRAVIHECAERGVGVVVKKGLASGRLDPTSAIRFVLSEPAVASIVVGSLTLDHLRDNCRIAAEVNPTS